MDKNKYEITRDKRSKELFIKADEEERLYSKESEFLIGSLHRLALSRLRDSQKEEFHEREIHKVLEDMQMEIIKVLRYFEAYHKFMEDNSSETNGARFDIKRRRFLGDFDLQAITRTLDRIDKDESVLINLANHLQGTPWAHDSRTNLFKRDLKALWKIMEKTFEDIDYLINLAQN